MVTKFFCINCGTKHTTEKELPCELTVNCIKCGKPLTVKLSDDETEVRMPYTDED